MSSFYNKGMTASTRELQSILYGGQPAKAAGKPMQAMQLPAAGTSARVNPWGWQYTYCPGLDEHAVLTVEVEGQTLSMKVYTQCDRTALSPHQDILLGDGHWDVSFDFLQEMLVAAEEARRLLKGQFSEYFKLESFWR